MNRVIKFRAWDKHSKRMRPVSEISWDWRALHHIRTNTYTFALSGIIGYMADESGADLPLSLDRDPEPIMQYTGRTDKNGKEVYEGDILKRPNDDPNVQVCWNDRGAAFKLVEGYPEDPEWWYYFDGNNIEEHEVIGNIWENPELLEAPEKGGL